jgi:membrane protease subunit HflK
MPSLLSAPAGARFPSRWDNLTFSEGDGRRPKHDGPPDLEELWQDFNRRLQSLFGRRGRGGGPLRGGGGMRGLGIAFGGVAAALFVIWLLSGFYQVPEGSAGVVLKFGKYKDTTGPGLWYHYPYPIESVEKVQLSSLHSIDIGRNSLNRETNLRDSSMLTEDENIIDVPFAVQFRVQDAADYQFNNANPDDTVEQAAETAVREIVGRSKMDYVLYEGREQIRIELKEAIQRILDSYRSGLLVTSVTLGNVQPPEAVQAAFDDAVKANQDRERAKNEGQAYANDVVPRARGDASRLVLQAEGYKAKVVATAQGDAERFKAVLTEYAKAPQVTRDRMYLQTMEEVYANSAKVLIDTRASSDLLYLPLDKLLDSARNAQAAPPVAGATVQPSAPAAPTYPPLNDDARSRDPIRSREREVR